MSHKSGVLLLLFLKICLIYLLLHLHQGYLRIGCMARDRGQIYEASDWFKDALQINQVSLEMANNVENTRIVVLYASVVLYVSRNNIVNVDLHV